MISSPKIYQLGQIIVQQSVDNCFTELSWIVVTTYTVMISTTLGKFKSPASQTILFEFESNNIPTKTPLV